MYTPHRVHRGCTRRVYFSSLFGYFIFLLHPNVPTSPSGHGEDLLRAVVCPWLLPREFESPCRLVFFLNRKQSSDLFLLRWRSCARSCARSTALGGVSQMPTVGLGLIAGRRADFDRRRTMQGSRLARRSSFVVVTCSTLTPSLGSPRTPTTC